MLQAKTSHLWKVSYAIILLGWRYFFISRLYIFYAIKDSYSPGYWNFKPCGDNTDISGGFTVYWAWQISRSVTKHRNANFEAILIETIDTLWMAQRHYVVWYSLAIWGLCNERQKRQTITAIAAS